MIEKRTPWKFILVLVVIAGAIALFALNRKMAENQQKRELETSIAKLLVNEYENVERVEFKGWGHSVETGMWGTTVIINRTNQMSLSFNS